MRRPSAAVRVKPLKRPTQARAKFTVQAIFDAFVRIWQRDGWDRLTTRTVALETGISVGTLYDYFPGKQALLSGYVRHCVESLVDAIDQQAVQPGHLPWQQRIHQLVRLSCGIDAPELPWFHPDMLALEAQIAEPKHYLRAQQELSGIWLRVFEACTDPHTPPCMPCNWRCGVGGVTHCNCTRPRCRCANGPRRWSACAAWRSHRPPAENACGMSHGWQTAAPPDRKLRRSTQEHSWTFGTKWSSSPGAPAELAAAWPAVMPPRAPAPSWGPTCPGSPPRRWPRKLAAWPCAATSAAKPTSRPWWLPRARTTVRWTPISPMPASWAKRAGWSWKTRCGRPCGTSTAWPMCGQRARSCPTWWRAARASSWSRPRRPGC